jgi:hypothetical protein
MSFALRGVVATAIAVSAPTAAQAENWTSLGKVVVNEWVTELVGVDLDSIRAVDGHIEARVVYVSPAPRQFSGVEFDYTVEIERYDCGGRRFHKFRQDYFVIGSTTSLGTFQERDEPSWIETDIPPNVADLVCRRGTIERSGSYPDPDAFARAARGLPAGEGERPSVSDRLGPQLTDLLGPELK